MQSHAQEEHPSGADFAWGWLGVVAVRGGALAQPRRFAFVWGLRLPNWADARPRVEPHALQHGGCRCKGVPAKDRYELARWPSGLLTKDAIGRPHWHIAQM